MECDICFNPLTNYITMDSCCKKFICLDCIKNHFLYTTKIKYFLYELLDKDIDCFYCRKLVKLNTVIYNIIIKYKSAKFESLISIDKINYLFFEDKSLKYKTKLTDEDKYCAPVSKKYIIDDDGFILKQTKK